jgi:cobalt-zinc-cadmium efflux system protein
MGDHSHPHVIAAGSHAHHKSQRAGERRRLALTMLVTAGILVAEAVGGWLSHSLALLSDAGHMLSDVISQGLALGALIIATRPADARRTYGWYRLEILAALLNGLTLFALAAGIFWSGIHRLRAPVEIHLGTMLTVAGIGLVANLIGAWLLHDAKSLNAKGAYLHILFDTLSSVGVVIGGSVMWLLHGAYWLDPVLSMAISVIIVWSAVSLVREAVDVLLETVPRSIDLDGVSRKIAGIAGVGEVHDLHIWTITSGMFALSAHIVVRGGHGGSNDELMNQVKAMLLADFAIAHTTLQLESEGHEHVGHVC